MKIKDIYAKHSMYSKIFQESDVLKHVTFQRKAAGFISLIRVSKTEKFLNFCSFAD